MPCSAPTKGSGTMSSFKRILAVFAALVLCVSTFAGCGGSSKDAAISMLMPDGIQPDIDYSNGLVEFLGIRHYVFNIQGGTGGILDEMARLGMICAGRCISNRQR